MDARMALNRSWAEMQRGGGGADGGLGRGDREPDGREGGRAPPAGPSSPPDEAPARDVHSLWRTDQVVSVGRKQIAKSVPEMEWPCVGR